MSCHLQTFHSFLIYLLTSTIYFINVSSKIKLTMPQSPPLKLAIQNNNSFLLIKPNPCRIYIKNGSIVSQPIWILTNFLQIEFVVAGGCFFSITTTNALIQVRKEKFVKQKPAPLIIIIMTLNLFFIISLPVCSRSKKTLSIRNPTIF